MPLGLVSSEQIDDFWMQNTRRRIFYAYPNGTAPLTGLLSMMDSEDTPQPEFGWNEERWASIKTTTAQGPGQTGNKTGPLAVSGGTTAAGDADGKTAVAANGAIRIYVASSAQFQEDDTIFIYGFGTAASGTTPTGRADVVGRVASVGTGFLEVVVSQAYATLLNGTQANGLELYKLGSAFAEGSRSRTGLIKFPTTIKNYTQIHKTAFELTRTALKAPQVYDKSGEYKRIAKGNGIDHMAQMEWTAFFGVRNVTTAVDPDTGQTVRRSFTGGLKWFLDQWELGTMYGQPDISGVAWQDAPNKRVISLGGDTITKQEFNELNSRVFERTNASDWSKLVLCGPGYLARVSDMFERQMQFTSLRENGHKGFDFELVKHTSNAGTLYYKQHPLFNEPFMRNSAFIIDLGYLGYRPLADSDTDIQPMIQLPDADKRKDQWLTEAGFEVRFPEACMYIDNLGGITL